MERILGTRPQSSSLTGPRFCRDAHLLVLVPSDSDKKTDFFASDLIGMTHLQFRDP